MDDQTRELMIDLQQSAAESTTAMRYIEFLIARVNVMRPAVQRLSRLENWAFGQDGPPMPIEAIPAELRGDPLFLKIQELIDDARIIDPDYRVVPGGDAGAGRQQDGDASEEQRGPEDQGLEDREG